MTHGHIVGSLAPGVRGAVVSQPDAGSDHPVPGRSGESPRQRSGGEPADDDAGYLAAEIEKVKQSHKGEMA